VGLNIRRSIVRDPGPDIGEAAMTPLG
jgi:hypothetical protein